MVLTVQNCIEIVKEDEKVICQSSRLPYYPLVVKRAKGAIVEDLDGNQYIDLYISINTQPKPANAGVLPIRYYACVMF